MVIIPTPASLPISSANPPTEAISQQNQQTQRVAASQDTDGSSSLKNNLRKSKEERDEARIRRLEDEEKKRKNKQQREQQEEEEMAQAEVDDQLLASAMSVTVDTAKDQTSKDSESKPKNAETPAALATYRFKPSRDRRHSLPQSSSPNSPLRLTAAMKLLRNYLQNNS